ncbi:glycoside hydrolase family 125 protein [Frateuria aurantia]
METRRDLLKLAATACMGAWMRPRAGFAMTAAGTQAAPRKNLRPPSSKRCFSSPAVELALRRTQAKIGDPKLAWMFENCFPNTLDTTVHILGSPQRPDTFVVTGDIDAMWLRDASAQVWPYLAYARQDPQLAYMLRGVIGRQARSVLLDPYANAFLPDRSSKALPWTTTDQPRPGPGIAERKWELDSLCYVIRLAWGYWKATADAQPYDEEWRHAMRVLVATMRQQQRQHGAGPYHFQRTSEVPTESLLQGMGAPARPVGMIYSMFRPSDDACTYPLFVPANLFAVVSLRQLAELSREVSHDLPFAEECLQLAAEVEKATRQYGTMHGEAGDLWAYEVDGYGNQLFMDDANAPGLMSLAYLGCCDREDPTFRRSVERAWSEANPYFFRGRYAEGIGGPHEGLDMIWPMSIIFKAFNSRDDAEIRQCLRWLRDTDHDMGFIHESFDRNQPAHFTRSWFAWANSLFGELIVQLATQRPSLLTSL